MSLNYIEPTSGGRQPCISTSTQAHHTPYLSSTQDLPLVPVPERLQNRDHIYIVLWQTKPVTSPVRLGAGKEYNQTASRNRKNG